MSKTLVLHPIDACFLKAEALLGRDRVWRAINAFQTLYLQGFLPRREDLARFSEKELRTWISKKAWELNKILKAEGFDIQLDDFPPDGFGVVSILDVLVEWLIAGVKTDVSYKDKQYPAVEIDAVTVTENRGGVIRAEGFTVAGHPYPIAKLLTKSGDVLWMTIANGVPGANFELAASIDAIRGSTLVPMAISKVIFPMVDLHQQEDIKGLCGMLTKDENGDPWEVAQALQETKMKITVKGARVKSAVAIGVSRCTSVRLPPPPVVRINQPFLTWLVRDRLSTPVMYAYISEDDWKDPGDLDSM